VEISKQKINKQLHGAGLLNLFVEKDSCGMKIVDEFESRLLLLSNKTYLQGLRNKIGFDLNKNSEWSENV
jgi:hypothetical protein